MTDHQRTVFCTDRGKGKISHAATLVKRFIIYIQWFTKMRHTARNRFHRGLAPGTVARRRRDDDEAPLPPPRARTLSFFRTHTRESERDEATARAALCLAAVSRRECNERTPARRAITLVLQESPSLLSLALSFKHAYTCTYTYMQPSRSRHIRHAVA